MGMEDNKILDELVFDLPFQPFIINLQKIKIMIHSIGVPTKKKACGFASSFYIQNPKNVFYFFKLLMKMGIPFVFTKKINYLKNFMGWILIACGKK